MNAPPYVPNHTLHTAQYLNQKITKQKDLFIIFMIDKRFDHRLIIHPNQLIKNLAAPTVPGNPPRRLKCKRCHDFLN